MLIQGNDFLEKTQAAVSAKISEFRLTKANTIDGLHFSAQNGIPWLHVRASNTEPVVRIMAEAADSKSLQQIIACLKKST